MAFGDIVQGPYTAAHASHPQATLGTAPTVGNLIVVVHVDVARTSAGDSPLAQALLVTQVEGQDDLAIYYRVVQGGDGQTYGCTSGNDSNIVLFEVEGPFQSSPLDVTASSQGDVDPATQSTGATGATAQASEFAVAAIADRDAAGSASGWTNSFVELSEGHGTYTSVYVATKVLSATGAVETTATLPTGDGSRAWGGMATFMAAGSSPSLDENPIWQGKQEWRAGRTGPQQLAIPRFRGEFGQ